MKISVLLILQGLLMGEDNKILSFAKPMLSISFLSSTVVLIIAAIGLRPGTNALAKYYIKESIAVRRPLKNFDTSRLPSFEKGWKTIDIPPAPDVGTEELLVKKFIRQRNDIKPKEVILFVTYYSEANSKVPHTPDVCYRQAGAVVKKLQNITIETPDLAQCSEIKARLILFKMSKCEQVVIFCFYVDGKFKHSREQVRWVVGKPGNRYTYFSKIEVVSNYPNNDDPSISIEECKTLFREAVSILISEHFPTKKQIKRR